MKFKDFLESKFFRGFLFGFGAFVILAVVFRAGSFFGYRRAIFSERLGENYNRIFGGPGREMMTGIPRADFPESHGAAGQIVKIELPNLFLADRNKVEKEILVSSSTLIRRFRDELKPADLQVNDFVVVIGQPNDSGQIEAKLIRVMPAPSEDPAFSPRGMRAGRIN